MILRIWQQAEQVQQQAAEVISEEIADIILVGKEDEIKAKYDTANLAAGRTSTTASIVR